MKVILASKSPRRVEILEKIVKEFEVVQSNFDENTIDFKGDIEKYVKDLSRNKAIEVSKRLNEPSIVISADTVVFQDGKVLEKPKNEEDAFSMLSSLSGNTHKVYSGICLINTYDDTVVTDCDCTEVRFSELNPRQIRNYINSGEPMDKAGAYGIQGLGGAFVEGIKGCYYNVMGLPLNKLYKALENYDITIL
ncbi:Maf-like protein [Clostridium perfringens]|uniref:dTTP/UTP pyrophosphatase n=1 Tax=Clostridium perfringens (strain 13 / Type A) TaxID=195102 RepID=NTPPA_CLOPE|nr:Maf-like protein [Clostridium perfringens]Q8XIH4.1 RecName: Full=dTTP/UTP pyrophosphatase; Short=dTTPase/UTPase; AltName: Full=Nucleoside triphosphate pyrophosphatase; AltName: Full=Nucleotide pyrophosphatase; Short=Nucleotide PPase [Clostridium perfringens str. 13]EJT5922261.1 Maf-like protein [Clostridium perfringens]EJT6613959.1 Maf-like protein [Clostridium perfringens]ELP5177663.1 Maf-like protein [Clostridium perfringens]ELP5180571.1 Maf-like protein [Clostridium perfringens]ELP51855